MGRGESIHDTARALDQYMDVFAGRLWSQDDMDTVAANVHRPVLNACTPVDHTTHVIGELMCIKQAKGKLEGLNLVYTGMARGILHSFIRVCPLIPHQPHARHSAFLRPNGEEGHPGRRRSAREEIRHRASRSAPTS